MSVKSKYISLLNGWLDTLRDCEGITGEKALKNCSYLLILKLIEPIFTEIGIDNYPYDFSHISDENVENHKNKLLKIARFSNLLQEKEDNIPVNMGYLWDDILSVHPITKKIFLKGKGFDIKHKATYRKLIDKLNLLDLSGVDYDVLGEAYEEIIQISTTPKFLGQFFTQPLVKKLMVKLVNPQLHADGTIETCADPAMGTGGFLVTILQHIQEQAKSKNISLDWDFIKTQGIYGKELEPDTYQLAVSNMLISSAHMFANLDCGDSIREPITRQFDIILANPPFGINGLKYEDIQNPFKSSYTPIKSNSAVPLFLQSIISMLNVNGKCAIVLPSGEDLHSKKCNLNIIRECLMKTCELHEVIHLPSGIFSKTSIKTCVLFFTKRKEMDEIIEIKSTKKKDEYKFLTSQHQTSKVKFYNYNPSDETKRLLVEVDISDIARNNYSLNYADYVPDELEENRHMDDVVVKSLGEICKDITTKNTIPVGDKIDGPFRYFSCSRDASTHNESHYEGTFIIHGSRGTIKESVFVTDNEKFAIGSSMIISQVNSECLPKYVYYYLLLNAGIFDKHITGTAVPMISKLNYYNVKIPIPSLERQQKIVDYLTLLDVANNRSLEKIAELKTLNDFCLTTFGDNIVKTLGEMCCFKNGKAIKTDNLIQGEYPVIGGGQQPMGFHNAYNTDANTILCSSSGAYSGFISKYKSQVWASDCFSIKPQDDSVSNNYLYYVLKGLQSKIYKKQTGTAQPHVYSKDIQDLKISLPSLERQQEIAEYCEFNDKLINELYREIENNKIQAQRFIKTI